MPNNQHPLWGAFLVLCHVLCGIVAYLTMDKVFMMDTSLSPITAMFWGFLGASLTAGFSLSLRKKTRQLTIEEFKTHGKLIATISIITSIGAMMWAWSMREATAGSVGLLSKADVILSLAIGAIFLNEKFTKQSLLGAAISLVGLGFIANLPKEISFTVVVVILVMKSLYALQSYMVKKSGQTLKGIPFTFWRVSIMTGFLLLGAIATNSLSIPAWPVLTLLFVSQLFGAYIGRVCYFEAHKYLGIGKLNLLSLTQPVFLLLGAWLLLDEPMPAQKLIGAAIILSGILLIALEKWQREKKFSVRKIFAKLRGKKDDIEAPIDFS